MGRGHQTPARVLGSASRWRTVVEDCPPWCWEGRHVSAGELGCRRHASVPLISLRGSWVHTACLSPLRGAFVEETEGSLVCYVLPTLQNLGSLNQST